MFNTKLLFYPGNGKWHVMNTNSVVFFAENNIDEVPVDAKLIIAVWEILNPGNMGNIIRVAHNIGAERVLFVNEKPAFNNSKIKKTAGFSFDKMTWEFISHHDFFTLLEKDFELVVLETCDGAKSIYNTNYPKKPLFLQETNHTDYQMK